MSSLPAGTITFLFSDVEGSTRLWEGHSAAMRAVMARHDALIRTCVERCGGAVVRERGEGDSSFAVFSHAAHALAAAAAIQLHFRNEPWELETGLRVRIGVHTGSAELRENDYYGDAVNRCARIRALAHGGQTLISGVSRELVAGELPPSVQLRDLGLHRLKDLQKPEQIYQLVHPQLENDFPPLQSLDYLPTNLPQQLTRFIGRQDELEAVKAALTENRLVTVVAPGGAGKTRLALQAAAEELDHHKDGVWLAELAAVMEPQLVSQTVARALNVPLDPGSEVLSALRSWLRDKELLLVLDNCEHLLPACVELADSLLRHCPRLKILATSREGLRIDGEQILHVPPLAVPSLRLLKPIRPELVQTISPYPSVQLFVERARSVQESFRLTDRNAPSVVQICYLLDGLPLAIELAAARISLLAPDQIAARLDHAITLLKGGSRVALERHQTLRAAIDWSHQLLEPAEQDLFRRLAVFSGGWTLEAADSVCADPGEDELELLDHLNGLVQKSLVLADQDEDGSVVRYRLLETVRQYSAEKLAESGEAEETARRHRDWVLELAERAEPELQGPRQGDWLDKLELEHGNIRVALDYSTGDPAGCEKTLRVAVALFWFWYLRGYISEGLTRTRGALSHSEWESATGVRARNNAANFLSLLNQFPEAEAYATRAVSIAERIADSSGRVIGLNTLGLVMFKTQRCDEAVRIWLECLSTYRSTGDLDRVGRTLLNLGVIYLNQQRFSEADVALKEAESIWASLGNSWLVGLCVHNQCQLLIRLGRKQEALQLYRHAIKIGAATRSYSALIHWMTIYSALSFECGDAAHAATIFGAVEAFSEQNGIESTSECDYTREVDLSQLCEEPYLAYWKHGRIMDFAEAVEMILNTTPAHSTK